MQDELLNAAILLRRGSWVDPELFERAAKRMAELESDAPVTGEWLRDVWGWYLWGGDSAAPYGGQHLLWMQSGYVVVCGTPVCLASECSQGRFTMLAIGLGVENAIAESAK